MVQAALISITGTQQLEGEEPESIQLVTEGSYCYEPGYIRFSYVETQMTGLEGVVTTFTIEDEKTVTLRRTGKVNSMMVFELGRIDDSLYEAADLDGANKFQQFRYIILPSIKTIVTLNIILSITGALSAFEAPFVITSGANGTGTFFVVMNTIAHTNQKVGLASAMAVFLLVIIIIAKFLQDAFFKYIFRNASADDEAYDVKKKKKKAAKLAAAQGKGGN